MRYRKFHFPLFVILFSGIASAAHVHSYVGRDRSKWTISQSPSAANPNTVLYAGGEYNISIAKTTMDAAGNLYIAGSQIVDVGSSAAHSVFVEKIDPSGATIFITRFGGKGEDIAMGIGVDTAGRVFVGGNTTSPDFPLLHAVQTEFGVRLTVDPAGTGFVFALDASGAILWSTYFGGSFGGTSGSTVNAVTADAAGNAYVTGTSGSSNMITTPGAYQRDGHFFLLPRVISGGFVAKFNVNGQVVYSTWLGGSILDCDAQICFHDAIRIDAGVAIAVDNAGNAYVAGYSDTVDFPVTPGAFQTTCNCDSLTAPYPGSLAGSYHAFLTKLKPDGSGLVYSTLLGDSIVQPGAMRNEVLSIDNSGNAYVAFQTSGTKIAVPASALQSVEGGGYDVLLLEVNPAGSALLASTYLGGNGDESVTGLAIDQTGNIYVSGGTASPNFPDAYALFLGGSDFIAELSPSFDKILFSVRLPGGSAAQDILLSPSNGALITAGSSGHVMRLNPFRAASIPVVLGVGNAANGTIDSALPGGELVNIFGNGIGPAKVVSDASYPLSLGGVQVSMNGMPAHLLSVSSNQIQAVVPFNPPEVALAGFVSPVLLEIRNNGTTFGPFTTATAVNQPNPGIFLNADGDSVLNQDGSVNAQSNPAHGGTIISIWATGIGSKNGQASVSLLATGCCFTSPSQSNISAFLEPLPITYVASMVSPVNQVNARLPSISGGGVWTLYLASGGVMSPPVAVYLAP